MLAMGIRAIDFLIQRWLLWQFMLNVFCWLKNSTVDMSSAQDGELAVQRDSYSGKFTRTIG